VKSSSTQPRDTKLKLKKLELILTNPSTVNGEMILIKSKPAGERLFTTLQLHQPEHNNWLLLLQHRKQLRKLRLKLISKKLVKIPRVLEMKSIQIFKLTKMQ